VIAGTYPHPNVKISRERGLPPQTDYLHRDQLDSVVLIAGDLGVEKVERLYEPFGADTEFGIPDGEDFGFIGERKDAVTGLQYLNARYYDPELAMFIQPDWFEVTLVGVGTNRYSYSFNDPVNLRDPSGNDVTHSVTEPDAEGNPGDIETNIEIGWKGNKNNSPYTDEEIIDAIEKDRSGRTVTITNERGELGTYTISTSVTIVEESQTNFIMAFDSNFKGQANVKGVSSHGKLMTFGPNDGLGTISHEFGHLSGALDKYSNTSTTTTVNSVTTTTTVSVPRPGFTNNIMGDPKTLGILSGKRPGKARTRPNFINGINIQEFLRAPKSGKSAIRNGVSVRW